MLVDYDTEIGNYEYLYVNLSKLKTYGDSYIINRRSH